MKKKAGIIIAIVGVIVAAIIPGGRLVYLRFMDAVAWPDPVTYRLVRCEDEVSRKIRVDYLGYDDSGQYVIGLRLAWSEIPAEVMEDRKDQLPILGRGGISGHQVTYAIPVSGGGAPLIPAPPSFYASGTEGQKKIITDYPSNDVDPDAYNKYFQTMFYREYIIKGFEYQYVDENGSRYRSPYFDLTGWSEVGHEQTDISVITPARFEPDFMLLGSVSTADDVWPIPDGEKCLSD